MCIMPPPRAAGVIRKFWFWIIRVYHPAPFWDVKWVSRPPSESAQSHLRCLLQVLNPKKKGKKKKYVNSGTVSTPPPHRPACVLSHVLTPVWSPLRCASLPWNPLLSGLLFVCFFFLFVLFLPGSDPFSPPHPVYHCGCWCVCACVCLPGNSAVLQSGVRVYLCGFHPRRVSGIIISLLLQRVSIAAILAFYFFIFCGRLCVSVCVWSFLWRDR